MHKQHLPSLLTVAAGFTSPGSSMIAGERKRKGNEQFNMEKSLRQEKKPLLQMVVGTKAKSINGIT